MIDNLLHKNRSVIKYETLYMFFSILLFLYFVVATFETFGAVKDRGNYNLTFENFNNFSSTLQLLTGSSLLYGIFSFFGNSYAMLSFYSILFLSAKLILLKKIFHSWGFVLLYLVKFAFVVDLILLKESLGLLLVLFAYHSRHKVLRYMYIFMGLLTHLSITPLVSLKIGRLSIIMIISIFLVFSIYSSSEISLIYYYFDKFNSYNAESDLGESFLYQNPIFWMSTIVLLWSLGHLIRFRRFRPRVLLIQLVVFLFGLLHPVIGVPGFRLWQVGSFIDLIALRYLNSKILFAIYLLVNLLFLIYGTIILRGYLN